MTTSSLDLLSLPREVLSTIFLHLSTPSFLQTILSCRILFTNAAESRNVLLHHLNHVPGIKLGLSDHALTTLDLFQLLRQRASEHLYGAHFRANCRSLQLRNGTLDARASCLAESTDYFNISLTLRQSLAVRHYGYDCVLKEHTPSPYADGKGKVLHVVHNKHLISVLYQWTSEQKDDLEIPPVPVHTSLNPARPEISVAEEEEKDRARPSKHKTTRYEPYERTQYHLVHYNAYSNFGSPDFYTITESSPAGFRATPVHLAVHSRLKCVIVWDSHSSYASPPLGDRQVVLYATDKQVGRGQEGTYTASVIYPLKPPHNYHKIEHETHGDALTYKKNKEYLASFTPRATAFHSNGQKVSLYSPSSVVPYAVLFTTSPILHGSSPSRIGAAPRTLNEVQLGPNLFRLDTPFYGSHAFSSSTDESDEHAGECTMVYLQLAHAQIRSQEVLCIIQSKIYVDADDCRHIVTLDDLIRQPDARVRIVARLWGWQPSKTTMTALDTVSVSPRGTRIAISCWNEVYVWDLNPEVLCEPLEMVVEEDQAGADESNAGSDAGSDTPSSIVPVPSAQGNGEASDVDEPNSSPSVSVTGTTRLIHPTNYYDLVNDSDLHYHVELKPIVLKLQGGAVARKMTWFGTSTKDVGHESKADAEDDAEEAEQLERGGISSGAEAQTDTPSTTETQDEKPDVSQQEDATATLAESEQPLELEYDQKVLRSTAPAHSSEAAPSSEVGHKRSSSLEAALDETEALVSHPDDNQTYKTTDSTPSCSIPDTLPTNSDPSQSLKPDTEPIQPELCLRTAPTPAADTPPLSTNISTTTLNPPPPPPPLTSLKPRKRRKRHTEDELIILTDRSVQLWNLGVWSTGKREKGWLDERLI